MGMVLIKCQQDLTPETTPGENSSLLTKQPLFWPFSPLYSSSVLSAASVALKLTSPETLTNDATYGARSCNRHGE